MHSSTGDWFRVSGLGCSGLGFRGLGLREVRGCDDAGDPDVNKRKQTPVLKADMWSVSSTCHAPAVFVFSALAGGPLDAC